MTTPARRNQPKAGAITESGRSVSTSTWSNPARLWPPAAANTRSPFRPLTDTPRKERVDVEVGELHTRGEFTEGFGT